MPLKAEDHVEQRILNQFELIKFIGKGAYGYVWKAKNKKTGKIYALKKVFDAFRNATDSQRTYRQVMFLTQLKHPNIVKLESVIRAENDIDLYLIFQYMQSDVHKVIQGNALKQIHQQYIIYQLLLSLYYMHSAGIIHRDLKPANILINSNSQIRVADFGLARLVHQQQPNSFIMTENIATRWYRAPQILLGSSKYTKSVDIWSIGCILAEMIYGKAILRGKTSFQQIALVVNLLGRPTSQDLLAIDSNMCKQILQNIKPYGNEKVLTLESLTRNQNSDLTDFLKRTLVYNPLKRITLEEAFQHPYVRYFLRTEQLKKFEGKISLSLNDNTKFSIGRYRKMLYEAVGISEQTPSRKISIIPSYSLLRSEKREIKSISKYKEKSRERYLSTNNKNQLNKINSITNISRKKSENQIRKSRSIKMISKSPDLYYSKFKGQKIPRATIGFIQNNKQERILRKSSKLQPKRISFQFFKK